MSLVVWITDFLIAMMSKIVFFIKKHSIKIVNSVLIVGVLVNTVGRFVPIYFVDPKIADYFGSIVFYLTIVSVAIATFWACYNSDEDNWRSASLTAIFTTFLAAIVLGIITIFDGFSLSTDVKVKFISKNVSKLKIIEQYVDMGALGGGERVILRKELTSFFKYEKLIDTNTINKADWVKQ